MYKIVKNVIEAGKYELTAMLAKIDTLWVQGSITDEDHQELVKLARGKADPAKSFAPLQAQIDALAARVAVLEAAGATGGEAEEWPEYVQPAGSHDAYFTGDRVTYNGKYYTCTAPEGVAVVWSPDVYPGYWEAVTV